MPRVSTDRLAARRQEILDGARRCFARYGYEGATVRRLEEVTGLSRGAIFHHYRDKDALFLALAEQDAARMADVVAEQGLVQVMRDLVAAPARATRDRLDRQARAGLLRDDVPVPVLAQYLELVLEGLVAHLAMGLPAGDLAAVLDLVEGAVRTQR
jgi:AcrR family transcriptional regulator